MTRFLVAIGTAFVLTTTLSIESAQSGPGPGDCDQVRQAVATYGYSAARHYALVHYGKQAVAYGDRCLGGGYKAKKKYVHYRY